jgi:hypothetical protein
MMEQLSLWDETCFDTAPKRELPAQREFTESKDAYERRRVAEMAEKLGWPVVRVEPFNRFPGIAIEAGKPAWSVPLKDATDSTIGPLLLPLRRQLNPLTLESIDEKTGLHDRPVEVISRVEERHRGYMMELAEALDWPRISYWSANRTQVVGPGRSTWQKYYTHGCCGLVADVTGALEREPESVLQERSV